jgi:hypothetical protein
MFESFANFLINWGMMVAATIVATATVWGAVKIVQWIKT